MDGRKNFAYGTVLTPPTPAASGGTLVLAAGNGSRFPDPAVDGAFNTVVWASGSNPLSSNAEIIRVTARAGDVLTITRQQESTSARTIVAGDQVALAITDKLLDDLQSAIADVLTVAPSDASAALKATASFVCDGTEDDLTISAALSSLPFAGGVVTCLPGNYFFGTTASSFVYGVNTKGGLTLKGSGRRQGAIFHVPAATSATCAVKMAATNGGSQTVRDVFITFDDPTATYCHGIWMQSAEAQVYDCCVTHSSGHGIILDGEPSVIGGAPVNGGTSGTIRGCEVQQAGAGCSTAFQGQAADAYVVTGLHENAVITGCFVNGGSDSAGGTLAGALVNGNSYTALTVTPLTHGMTAGEQVVIETQLTTPPTRQIITLAADAAAGATALTVTSFTANFSYTAAPTVLVCSYTKMQTRAGFRLDAITHLDDCHAYFCYQTGLNGNQASVCIEGGEYETNGWTNMRLLGSLIAQAVHNQVSGINTYGDTAYCSIFCFGCLSMTFTNNYIDGGPANNAAYFQSCNSTTITGNTFVNGTTTFGSFNSGLQMQSCADCVVVGNTVTNNLAPGPGGTRLGANFFSCSNIIVANNNFKVTTGTALAQASCTGKFANNLGYNPVGVVTVAVPASTVAVAAVPYDRTFYITAGAAATTIAISGGPTITLTASVLNQVRLPASQTMTPTYVNPPTWVVEGE